MKRDQSIQPDDRVELLERPLISFLRGNIIPRGKDMAGIDTNGHPLLFFYKLNDLLQLLETITQRTALSSRRFENTFDPIASRLLVNEIQRLGNELDALASP